MRSISDCRSTDNCSLYTAVAVPYPPHCGNKSIRRWITTPGHPILDGSKWGFNGVDLIILTRRQLTSFISWGDTLCSPELNPYLDSNYPLFADMSSPLVKAPCSKIRSMLRWWDLHIFWKICNSNPMATREIWN